MFLMEMCIFFFIKTHGSNFFANVKFYREYFPKLNEIDCTQPDTVPLTSL